MDNNPNRFGQSIVPNPFAEEDTHDTNSRDSESSQSESDTRWERLDGRQKMEISCFWYFADDQIVTEYDGVQGYGDTPADALEDLAERLRRRSD